MANKGDQMTVDEAIAAVRKAEAFGCGSDTANVLADEVERLREELAGVKLERDVANSAADTVGDVACRFKLALRNLCRAAPEAIRDAPSTRTEEFERFLGEAECLLSELELREVRPSSQEANAEFAKVADAFRLALQNLCTAAGDILSDVPGARRELQVRLDEADRVLRGVVMWNDTKIGEGGRLHAPNHDVGLEHPVPPPPEKYQLVQMRILRETVADVEELQGSLNTNNRTDAVARAIQIAALVVRAMSKGQKLQLVSDNGSREKLIIPGLVMRKS